MELKKLITKYTMLQGISGAERIVSESVAEDLKNLGISCEIDEVGNVTGRILSPENKAKTILLEAHIDQIGLMVSGVDEDGYVKFVNIGGVDERILCGLEVEIVTDKGNIYGVIGSITKNDKEDKPRNPKVEEVRVDIGFSKVNASTSVNAGDNIIIKNRVVELLNDRLSSAALDNRSGVAAIIDVLSRIDKNKLPYNIEFLFSTQEELGLHGAFTGIRNNKIDMAIAVDVTHGTTPDSVDETGVFPLGSGAVICRGPNLHFDYTKKLIDLAKEKNISYAIEVAPGGSGTTAWALQIVDKGIPVTLISIPLRYMHTNVELIDLNDVKAVSDLLYEVVVGGIEID